MIEAYKTNTPMRETFYRMNDIKHAEVWNTDDGYQVALCGSEGCLAGFGGLTMKYLYNEYFQAWYYSDDDGLSWYLVK